MVLGSGFLENDVVIKVWLFLEIGCFFVLFLGVEIM